MTDIKFTPPLLPIPGVGMPPATKFEKLVMSVDKLWAGETEVEKGKFAHLCPFTYDGTKWTGATAIELPYPAGVKVDPSNDAPQISGLSVDATGNVWVCDSAYGMVYYVSGSTADIVYTRPTSDNTQQFWAMTPVKANNKEYICVLDTRAQILLFDVNTRTAVSTAISLGAAGTTYSAHYFTYHAKTQVLWSLLEDTATGNMSLSALKMQDTKLPASGDAKVYLLTDVNRHTATLKASPVYNDLFLGQDDGTVVCLDITNGDTEAPKVKWKQPVPQHDGVTAALDYLEVDKAGYLWAVDFGNPTTKGCIYGLDNISGAPVELSLQKNAPLTNEVAPAMMVWHPEKDALLVADSNANNQIVQVDVKSVGPVGPDGKALYDLTFEPTTGTAVPNAVFSPLKIKATNKGSSTVAEVPVAFQVTDKAIMALGDDSPALVPTGAAGLPITQLKAAGKEGQTSTLTATGRGGANSTFTGKIEPVVTSVSISPKDVRYTMQEAEFSPAAKMPGITVLPASSSTQVHVALSGPASTVSGGSPAQFEILLTDQTDVAPGDQIPAIMAGKTAGPVTITASESSHTDTLTWHVLPMPDRLKGGLNASYTVRNFANSAMKTQLVLQGEEVKGLSGHPAPVPHWYVKVSLDGTVPGGITNLRFKPDVITSTDDLAGKWIILQTNDSGEIIIPFDHIEGIAAGNFKLVIEASYKFDDKTGPWNLARTTFPIQINRSLAE